MSKGLKQMVSEALTEQPAPVTVSDEAQRALAYKMREWSGWRDSTLVLGDPSKHGSPFACCDHTTHQFTANADRLVLNPNRVLLTVTPFRLKQEAVLTGALLHEAGHARYSKWAPRTAEQAAVFRHSDGTEVAKATMALARVMEEPRIEGLLARDAAKIGADGLDWTMRASAAHLIPMTTLAVDPNQKILDVITSWALRAGRQIALAHRTDHTYRGWVPNFTQLMLNAVEAHLVAVGSDEPLTHANRIRNHLVAMIMCDDHTGPTIIDTAREILTLLFPETEADDQPEAGGGCSASSAEGETEETDEDESEESDEDGPEETDEDEAESEDGDSDEDGDSEEDSEVSDGSDTDESEGEPESKLSKALRDMENQSKQETEEEAEEEQQSPGGLSGGDGSDDGDMGAGFRAPTKDEREIQKGAERFLRNLIAPSETSRVVLTESPSATVDGAALSAWKAGGQVRDPMFFKRTRRGVATTPPVKIAVLVDVSGSMDELQKPSAILSWALASAALDLRNFAGRGAQIESTLIHWGTSARVIQKNGEVLPGIREVMCLEGTSAMHLALDLVEEQLPGFFDLPDNGKPENRLLVQFTDWELAGWSAPAATDRIHKALAAGVNMVTVAPKDYNERWSSLPDIMKSARVQRGASSVMRYSKMFPEQVWDHAAEALS